MKVRRIQLKTLTINFALFFALVIFLEGTVSIAWTVKRLCFDYINPLSTPGIRSDAELGWTGIEHYSGHPSEYQGEGIRMNSQGWRADREVPLEVPEGKLRIVCSGDSQTFGMLVGNGKSWCDLLAVQNPQYESVNLGIPAYGTDQAYLRYVKYRERVKHQIHILAATEDDFVRMQGASFLGLPKPYFRVDNGSLVLLNHPVPTKSRLKYWLIHNSFVFKDVSIYQAFLSFKASTEAKRIGTDSHCEVLEQVLKAAQKDSVESGAQFVFVSLPYGARVGATKSELRLRIDEIAKKYGFPHIDLVERFNELPLGQVWSSITWDKQHFSEEGHKLMAHWLKEALSKELPISLRGISTDEK